MALTSSDPAPRGHSANGGSRSVAVVALLLCLSAGLHADQVLRYNGATGAFIDAFVSSGSGGLDDPYGLAFGPDGHLYVSSNVTHEVLRYNGATGAFIDVFVSSGSGGLDDPFGLTFGPDGNLYVSSGVTHEVLRYNGATGAFINAFVSSGSGGLDAPFDPFFGPDGHLYVSSNVTSEVLRYNGATGAFIDVFVSAGSGGLDEPTGLVFGPDGNLYVCDVRQQWVDLGNALAGINGEPLLEGAGTLLAGDPVTLTLSNAKENSTTNLVIGATAINAAFKGGVLVPAPTLLFLGLPTGPIGTLPLASTWPSAIPPNTTFYFQHWIVDAAGPQGWAASNGLSGTTPP